jgi:3-oxoacyl-[acyl-carrier protein] reductase
MGEPVTNGPRALVLGGHGDIGRAIAVRLHSDGFDVIAVGRSTFDLGNPSQTDAFLSREGNRFDILVHCAGLNRPTLIENLSDAEIRESLEVNLIGFLRVARACLPYWRSKRFGRIVVISSIYGFLARSGRLPYVMAKHALNGAVKTLAIEWAPFGVLVNALSPGYIGTRMTYENNPPETIARFVAGIPVGRLGTPEDIAEVAAFLCSSNNRYLTGQDLVVDGGFSIGGFQGG